MTNISVSIRSTLSRAVFLKSSPIPAIRAATRSRICLRTAISTAVSFISPGLGICRRFASASSGVRRESRSARICWMRSSARAARRMRSGSLIS